MNEPGYRLKLIFILLFLSSSFIYAQKKISHDGYASAGGKLEYKGFGESFYRVKIQLEVKINDFIEAQVDIRGRSGRREVELREISGEFKYWDHTRLSIGNLKKRFGTEELVSREELYTVERSLINRHISPMGYVGREVGVQVYRKWKERKQDNNDFYSYYLGVSYNDSRAFGANGRISVHNVFGLSQFGFDAVYQQLKGELIFGDPLDAFAFSADVSKQTGHDYTDAEVFVGKDPFETKVSGFSGDERSVYFAGIKSLHVYRFEIDEKGLKAIEPVVLLSFLAPDTRDFSVNKYQILIGINFYFEEDVRLLINGDLISSNGQYDKDQRYYTGSMIITELQFRW